MLEALLLTILIVLVVTAWLLRGWWGRRRGAARAARARRSLAAHLERLEQEFLRAAAASGKPRGLTWAQCNFHDEVLLAHDRATGDVYALRAVTIRFEAVAGGDMEEVEAVGNLRYATAVFVYRRRRWTTDGRAIFNLGPQETLEKYRESLVPLTA